MVARGCGRVTKKTQLLFEEVCVPCVSLMTSASQTHVFAAGLGTDSDWDNASHIFSV